MNTEREKKNQNAQMGSLRRVLEFSSLIQRKCQGKGCSISALSLWSDFPVNIDSRVTFCPSL